MYSQRLPGRQSDDNDEAASILSSGSNPSGAPSGGGGGAGGAPSGCAAPQSGGGHGGGGAQSSPQPTPARAQSGSESADLLSGLDAHPPFGGSAGGGGASAGYGELQLLIRQMSQQQEALHDSLELIKVRIHSFRERVSCSYNG